MIVDSVDVCCVSSRQNDGLFKGFIVEATLLLSHFSRVRLCDPIDGSPPGSPVPGILQARSGLPFPSPVHESEK